MKLKRLVWHSTVNRSTNIDTKSGGNCCEAWMISDLWIVNFVGLSCNGCSRVCSRLVLLITVYYASACGRRSILGFLRRRRCLSSNRMTSATSW